MAYIYEDVQPSLIPNTIMKKRILNGVHKSYTIEPIENHVLHDNALDYDVLDEMHLTVIGRNFGYSPSSVYVTCGANYDFTPHIVTDENGNTYTAYGNRDFFAVPESDVPADQIFGVDEPEHETI